MGIVNITLLSMFVASLSASCSQINVFCVHLYSVVVIVLTAIFNVNMLFFNSSLQRSNKIVSSVKKRRQGETDRYREKCTRVRKKK